MAKTSVLIIGRDAGAAQKVQDALRSLEGDVQTRIATNSILGPLRDLPETPLVLILLLGAQADADLAEVASSPGSIRPATIVTCDQQDPELMRLAMKASVRDFIVGPVEEEGFLLAVRSLLFEEMNRQRGGEGRINVFINAKGGSGATFLASNIAYILRVESKQSVGLVDLDFQFASTGLSLDLKPRLSLLEALQHANELDPVALEAYVVKHSSGLALLAPPTEQIMLPGEVDPTSVRRLIDVAGLCFEHLVIDLPRQIDPIAVAVAERASRISVVIQQSLPHVRDAKRLLRVLRRDLDVADDRIGIVINRYDRKSRFQLSDMERALEIEKFALIESDFAVVDAATNLGIPVYDYMRNAPITQSLVKFARELGGYEDNYGRKGILRRAFDSLTGNT